MYLENALHLSYERFIFDAKNIVLSAEFVRFKSFKRKNEIEKYYVDKREIMKKFLKSLRITQKTVVDEFDASFEYLYLLEIILQTDVKRVTIKNNRIELK